MDGTHWIGTTRATKTWDPARLELGTRAHTWTTLNLDHQVYFALHELVNPELRPHHSGTRGLHDVRNLVWSSS